MKTVHFRKCKFPMTPIFMVGQAFHQSVVFRLVGLSKLPKRAGSYTSLVLLKYLMFQRVFIKCGVLSEDFKIFRALAFLCSYIVKYADGFCSQLISRCSSIIIADLFSHYLFPNYAPVACDRLDGHT